MMRKLLLAGPILAVTVAATPVPTPTPKPPYPEIAHVVSSRFCGALRTNVGPAIKAMLDNDHMIAQTKPLFSDYNKYVGSQSLGMRDLTLVRMENYVGPLVANLADIEKYLQDPIVFPDSPTNAEDAELIDIRNKLEQVAAAQEESLDVINGFVATEQLGQMQHEGFDQANAINGDANNMIAKPTADPMTHDTSIAGLPANPYYIDPATVPGLSVGTNRFTHVMDGLQWTRDQATAHEAVAAKAVIDNLRLCNATHAQPPPSPSPKP
jgi:hypothetical protein